MATAALGNPALICKRWRRSCLNAQGMNSLGCTAVGSARIRTDCYPDGRTQRQGHGCTDRQTMECRWQSQGGHATSEGGEIRGHGLHNAESEVPGQHGGPRPPGSVLSHNSLDPGLYTICSTSRHHTRASLAPQPPSVLSLARKKLGKEPLCRPLSCTRAQPCSLRHLTSLPPPPWLRPAPPLHHAPLSGPAPHPIPGQAHWMKLTAQAGSLGRCVYSGDGGDSALVAHCWLAKEPSVRSNLRVHCYYDILYC